MQLKQTRVPVEFLDVRPDGIRFASKQGGEFLIVDRVSCPEGHNLMSSDVRIHGEPSIRVRADTGESSGLLFIDAFWGGHEKLWNFIPALTDEHQTLSASCPKCGVSLIVNAKCRQEGCSSERAILFSLPGGANRIYACARLGCPSHHIEVTDVPQEIARQVDEINYFGTSTDSMFVGI